MKCKNCTSCKKGYYKSNPNAYVCISACRPFFIQDIDKECSVYKDLEPELWSWNEMDDEIWIHGTFHSKEEAIKDAVSSLKAGIIDTSVIYLGKCEYVPLRTDVDVEKVLEELDEAYYEDTCCEAADYLYENVTDEQFQWLQNKFSEIMKEFHKKINLEPGWFNVTNVEKVDLK